MFSTCSFSQKSFFKEFISWQCSDSSSVAHLNLAILLDEVGHKEQAIQVSDWLRKSVYLSCSQLILVFAALVFSSFFLFVLEEDKLRSRRLSNNPFKN